MKKHKVISQTPGQFAQQVEKQLKKCGKIGHFAQACFPGPKVKHIQFSPSSDITIQ